MMFDIESSFIIYPYAFSLRFCAFFSLQQQKKQRQKIVLRQKNCRFSSSVLKEFHCTVLRSSSRFNDSSVYGSRPWS